MASVGLTPAPVSANFENSPEAEVTLEDQKSINRFARLNAKEEDLDVMLKNLQRQLDNVKEANDELMLADDDDDLDAELDGDSAAATRDYSNIHFRVGESFMAMDKDEAEQMLEEKRKELDVEVAELQVRIAPMKEEMSNIKAKLYAKFGTNINLDHDDDA